LGIVALIVAAALLLTGCSGLVDQDQTKVEFEIEVTLEPGYAVGQTFVARRAGLSGIEVWLEKGQGSQGEIRLDLRTDLQSTEDVATAALPLANVTSPGFYRLSFPPLRDSLGLYYYASLELDGEGNVRVGTGPGDAYLDGALYYDHVPLDSQMTFRLTYTLHLVLLDLGWATLKGLGLVAAAALLYIVPGWALLTWLWPKRQLPFTGGFVLSVGLSLALYPLLLLWTNLVGLHLGPLYTWIPACGGLAALIWRYRAWRPRQGWSTLKSWGRGKTLWPDLAFLALSVLILSVRLLVVRTLDTPMWGDSYQHTMITQLLVDNGGLFDSWAPYADMQSFTYHFGFHAASVVLHWLTGMEPAQAVLWGAQILNVLAVLSLYPLAMKVSGSRWAGVGAVLVAGLLSPMPMYYVNSGRYTQLAGQVILPAAVLIMLSAGEDSHRSWRLVVLSWITVGGLALTHYRVLIFYVLFIVAWILFTLRRATWRRVLSYVVGIGTGAAALFLPWFVHTLGGGMARNLEQQLTTNPSRVLPLTRLINSIGDPTFFLPPYLWLVLLAALGVSLWRKRRGALLIALWWLLLFVATNPGLLRLPGRGIITNLTLFLAAYIPAGILIGDLLGQVVDHIGSQRWHRSLTALLVIGIGLAGVQSRTGDVLVSKHALVTRPDLRAAAWIQSNTTEDARFLVNSRFAYAGTVVAGTDGGWWLPLTAGRANTMPPLTYVLEQGPWPGYGEWVTELTRQIQETRMDDPTMLAMLRERQVTHVYIGQQQGRVNYTGPHVLQPEQLVNSSYYQPVYHQDRVWVFEVLGSAD
jgi:hypothetical protein